MKPIEYDPLTGSRRNVKDACGAAADYTKYLDEKHPALLEDGCNEELASLGMLILFREMKNGRW
ncbi:hypothetical protein [Paenibacillus lautus]|uniref:hypothetical protein n=1 Tax=Paenibacillus lautus TaxID=1401 RepID=UPI003D2CCFCB